jgi:hypothetical protein
VGQLDRALADLGRIPAEYMGAQSLPDLGRDKRMDAQHHHTNPAFMALLKITMVAASAFAVIAPLVIR